MKIKYKFLSDISKLVYLNQIRELIELCDKEFVPPLSSRSSTTQDDFSPRTDNSGVEDYYKTVSDQSLLVALYNNEIVGFMSYRTKYTCEHIDDSFLPNIYITTIIVKPTFRRHGIARVFYEQILNKYKSYNIFTRTWSTNLHHIRLLHSFNFHEHCYLNNDRGNNIDTIYFIHKSSNLKISDYIKQYRLSGNIFFSVLLTVFSVVFIMLWIYTSDSVFHELSLAIATSLMASVLCLASDTFLKIHNSKNDKYITQLKSFGIENLQFYKNEILEEIIPKCREEIWISGYRLIMTGHPSFRKALVEAAKRSRSLNIKILITPPWSDAYKLVYGTENVIDNYINIFSDLIKCIDKYNLNLEVRFTQKPIFNDTYKVDNRFITGPYLHCADRYKNRIMAKDFFSLDISHPEKELYNIIYQDFMTVWDEATSALDNNLFSKVLTENDNIKALPPDEKIELVKTSCIEL